MELLLLILILLCLLWSKIIVPVVRNLDLVNILVPPKNFTKSEVYCITFDSEASKVLLCTKMACNDNLRMQKCAVLLNKIAAQAIEWRHFLEKRWDKLTEGLENTTILFITGRHGLEDGTIGDQDENVKKNQLRQVPIYLYLYLLDNVCKSSF